MRNRTSFIFEYQKTHSSKKKKKKKDKMTYNFLDETKEKCYIYIYFFK